MPEKTHTVDMETMLGTYTLSNYGRKRPIVYKKPRDRLIESLGNQIGIVRALKAGRDPKESGLKAHRMFFEHQGRSIVQIQYTHTPLDLTTEADAVVVDSLDGVEAVLNSFVELTRASVFDGQMNRIAGEWAAKLAGQRGRKPRTVEREVAYRWGRSLAQVGQRTPSPPEARTRMPLIFGCV